MNLELNDEYIELVANQYKEARDDGDSITPEVFLVSSIISDIEVVLNKEGGFAKYNELVDKRDNYDIDAVNFELYFENGMLVYDGINQE